MIEWNARFNASSSTKEDDLQIILLQGVLIDSTVNSNGWQIQDVDLADIAIQSVGAQLRLDHSLDVQKVKGQILEAEVDGPHSEDKGPHDPANEYMHIHFKAEVVTKDENLIIPITRGYVNRVSIGADAKTVFCSNCGKPTRPIKRCGCKSHEILKDIIVREYSIVTTPAYESAVFTPFSAAVDKYLEGETIEEETKKIDINDGSSITVTSDTTNINYYGSQSPSETFEAVNTTPTVVNTEIVADSETPDFVASDKEESVELKKEELEEVEAENEKVITDPKDAPDDFIVNVNKDEIKDPGIYNKAGDNKIMEDEKKEVEASSTDRIAALTAAVEQLVASLTAVRAEAEEDEEKKKVEAESDEDEKVEANDGYPLKDHSVDVGSPVNPDGSEPAPVGSPGPIAPAPKTSELPQKTPSMSAAGVQAGLIGANVEGTDVETKSVQEVFNFAAQNGY